MEYLADDFRSSVPRLSSSYKVLLTAFCLTKLNNVCSSFRFHPSFPSSEFRWDWKQLRKLFIRWRNDLNKITWKSRSKYISKNEYDIDR